MLLPIDISLALSLALNRNAFPSLQTLSVHTLQQRLAVTIRYDGALLAAIPHAKVSSAPALR